MFESFLVFSFIFLGFIAFAIFIYDAAIVPSYRFSSRLKLYRLRDEIRTFHLDGQISDEHYRHFEHFLNAGINVMSFITFFDEKSKNENDSLGIMHKEILGLDNEVSKKYNEMLFVFGKVILLNSIPRTVANLPVVAVYLIYTVTKNSIALSLNKVKSIMVLQTERIIQRQTVSAGSHFGGMVHGY